MKIERLMMAIAIQEGWTPPSPGDPTGGSRSYQNHNPGNLRASPFAYEIQDGYAVFKNDEIGRMALQYDLMQKAKGNTSTGLNGNSTLAQLIAVWAPAGDGNDPNAYLQNVCTLAALVPSMKLSELLAG
jgi:hypothetical protein